jgi:N-acetylglucosamine kinase-like BadF-type ATPase
VKELWICSDSVSSCAATIETDGVVITAGTGITALAVGKSGTLLHSLSGDGHLIGDVASAYWIGRMGLNYAVRSSDGRDQTPGSAQLLEVACQHFKADPYHLPHIVHQTNRAVNAIAQFAKLVNDLATTGNTKAIEIIDMAGDEITLIAETAKRVCEGGKDFQVALLGGVLAEGTMVYKNSVSKMQSRGLQVHKSNKTPLDGANILATSKDAGVYAPLIKIYRAS